MVTPDRVTPDDLLPDNLNLRAELAALNAQLPRQRLTLAELLGHEHPAVTGRDGTRHAMRRSELELIAGLLDQNDALELRLPVLLEVSRGHFSVRSQADIVARLLSALLQMNCRVTGGHLSIARAQLGVLRNRLPTTTQYVFTFS